MGTPTFLNGIVRAADKQHLARLRLAVTGAERCSKEAYDSIKEKCTNAVILEGYGVTECSPIISINDENSPQPFTIGKILPSLEYLLINPDSGKPLADTGTGILLVTGPSVFSGYLNYKGQSPFAEIGGKRWYNTADIVSVDEKGLFTFCGRLKRFVKLGGEMISLPAIEAVLEQHYPAIAEKGPAIAIEAVPDEQRPELVLFTAYYDIDRQEANDKIRQAGLSGLHNIRRVVKLEKIPTLATGKTDYLTLKELLRSERNR
jgi:long-chain-fatty-acid--[acyl-carrier-protein] ligase